MLAPFVIAVPSAMHRLMQQLPLSDYCEVPARIVWLEHRPLVEMRRIPLSALNEAFWDNACLSAPIIAVRPLDDEPLPLDAGPLSGAIFHTYRCGSTLLCRQLSAMPSGYAIAEPSFISQLVLGCVQDPPLLRARLLKVLALLSRGLGGQGQRIVVKWPGMLADRASLLAEALPDVPMIFLHRDPVEVLVSIEQRPLGNAERAPAALGLTLPADGASLTHQAALVIAYLCSKLAQVPTIRHCDYRRLDPVVVAHHFGLGLNKAEQAKMVQAGTWYSKSLPGSWRFVDDSAAKRAGASNEVLQLADRIFGPALAAALASLTEL